MNVGGRKAVLTLNCYTWREDAEMLTRTQMPEQRGRWRRLHSLGYPGPGEIGTLLGRLLDVCSHEELICADTVSEGLRQAV